MSMQPIRTSSSSRSSAAFFTPLFRATLALGLAAACNEYPLHDLGYTSGNDSGSSDTPDAPLPPVAELAREFAGSWVGTAEDPLALQSHADVSPPPFKFPSGSPRIRLELSVADGASFPYGTITFGDAPPPAPATDPDLPYAIESPLALDFLGEDASLRPPVEGFAYQLGAIATARDIAATGIDQSEYYDDGRAADGKLDFDFYPTEVFTSWCELQTLETCPPNAGSTSDDEGNCTYGGVPMDCGKASQCAAQVCACEEGYPCTASFDRTTNLTVRFSEDGLVGLFSGVFRNERGFQQPLGTVHFRRAQGSTEVGQ